MATVRLSKWKDASGWLLATLHALFLVAFLVSAPSLSGQDPPVNQPPLATVPPVTKLPIDEAKDRVEAALLIPRVFEIPIQEPELEGRVIRQSPEAGTQMRVGQTVTLFVAPQRVQMPALVGSTEDRARDTLSQIGLALAWVATQASTAPLGQVIDQRPRAGTGVSPRDTISITISNPQLVIVPTLVDSMLVRAEEFILQIGLAVGPVERQASTDSLDQVIAQRPVAGDTVLLGDTVFLTVSDPQLVTVPDVRGRSREDAKTELSSVGLEIGSELQAHSPRPEGSVLRQVPGPGDQIPRGSVVNLVLAIPDPAGSITQPPGGGVTSPSPDGAPVIRVAPEGFPWVAVGVVSLLTLAALPLAALVAVKLYRWDRERRNRRSKAWVDVRVKEGASIHSAIQAPREPIELEVRVRLRSPKIETQVRFPTGNP